MVAGGLPAPRQIDFHPDGTILSVLLFDEDAFDVWADAIGARRERPLVGNDGRATLRAYGSNWCGYHANVNAYLDHAPAVVPPDEVFDKVREIATADEAEEPS